MPVGKRRLKRVMLIDTEENYKMEFESCMRVADYLNMIYPEKNIKTLRDRVYRVARGKDEMAYERFEINYIY